MLSPRNYATTNLLQNGQVLVAGGWDALQDVLFTAELYNPSTNMWADAGVMPTKHLNAASALLPNGRVLVAGGTRSAGALSPDSTV